MLQRRPEDGGEPYTGAEVVNPAIATFIQLDDIRLALERLTTLMAAQVPEGVLNELVFSVAGGAQSYVRTDRPWFSFTITNDGPGTIYFNVNGGQRIELRVNESRDVDMKRGVIRAIGLFNTGTSTSGGRIDGKY